MIVSRPVLYNFTIIKLMKVLYYDCFAGISGDMNLGALIDLGVPPEFLISELKKLKLNGYEILITNEIKMGISGTKVTVKLHDNHIHKVPESIGDTHHIKDHNHLIYNHENHSKSHHHHHTNQRNLSDIKKIIGE